jgi:uncharacterized membrane protein YfcA
MFTGAAVAAVLLAVFAVSGYVQTLTGFAFGLLAMGSIGLLHLMPLPDAAIVVGLLVIVNALQVLRHGHLHVERRILFVTTLASLPMVAVGVWLVGVLSGEQVRWLRLLLATSIVLSGVQLVRPTRRREKLAATATTVAIGAVSGLMGGLFSAAGPPLAQHLYRQPLPLDTIRLTLVSTFAVNAVLRLGLVAVQGQLTLRLCLVALMAVPAVMLATWLARRHPPPLSPRTVRFVVFVLLTLSGLALGVPALVGIVAGP